MAWLFLIAAGFFEVVWAYALKQSEGFSRPVAVIVMLIGMILSFLLLSLSMKSLPLGTAYSIWTGIGAIGAFLVGIVALGETVSVMRGIAALLIVSGIVLMKLGADI